MNRPTSFIMDVDFDWVRRAIPRVMHEHPDLSRDGWKRQTPTYGEREFKHARDQMLTAEFAREVVTAWNFVGGTYLEKHDSYALKHAAERYGKENGLMDYVSNGALITGSILWGFDPVRRRDDPNCTFLKNGKPEYPSRD